MDKFAEYYNTPERVSELSEYVHLNMNMIMSKMTSEMRRKLDITHGLTNSNGYTSLVVSLYGRLFNELVYGLCGFCQTLDMKLTDILPNATIEIFNDLLNGKNVLGGMPRAQIIDPKVFEKYYLKHINELRANKDALPK